MEAQQFLAEFGHIARAPGGVASLRQLILQLAISGNLVPQLADDTSAEELIEANAGAKRELISRKVLKRLPDPTKVEPTETPWIVPRGWAWTRLGLVTNYGDAPKLNLEDVSGDTWVLELEDIEKDSSILLKTEIAKDRKFKSAKNGFPAGAVLYGKLRPYLDKVIIAKSSGVCTTEICPISFFAGINAEYLRWYLKSPYFISYANGSTYGMNLPRLGTNAAREALFPLAPQNEQSRIVAKIDELMGLCDKFEQQQKKRRKLQNALRRSTLEAVASAQRPIELRDGWERLEANFEQIFSKASDIETLRKALMDLAVSGLLSELNSEDETALELKQRILSAKERGITESNFSRKKNVKLELLEETTLPEHWETISLDDAISTIDAGWSPACLPRAREDESKWGVLKTTAVQMLSFLPEEHKELPAALEPRPQYQIKMGDILITRAGPKNRVGICCVVDTAPQRLMISDKLIRIHIVDDLIDPNFVTLCLSAGEPGRNIEKLKSGMADSQMNISQNKLRSITIPLPPLAEQQRILGALDGFMKTLDEYAAGLDHVARLGQQFSKAAIASVTGISIAQYEDVTVKAPQTKLISKLRLETAP
ncbi:MAG: restriction endonuclease subunit S, partial [Paracoccaceae bacterium]